MKLSRRHFLRAAGVSLALPWLDTFARGAPAAKPPRRMVCICAPLGMHPPYFFPKKSGKDYELTPYLDIVKEYRDDFTVISGLAHPEVGPSHDSIFSYLTAAPHPEIRAGFRNTISLDQFAADHIGDETRFPSLALSCEGFSLSWTRSGAIVPSDPWPSSVFARLFLEGRPEEVQAQRAACATDKASSIPSAIRSNRFNRVWAPTIATSSTNTSAASANWRSAWPWPRNGRRCPSRRWTPRNRRT